MLSSKLHAEKRESTLVEDTEVLSYVVPTI
jgi:hypothetical protein